MLCSTNTGALRTFFPGARFVLWMPGTRPMRYDFFACGDAKCQQFAGFVWSSCRSFTATTKVKMLPATQNSEAITRRVSISEFESDNIAHSPPILSYIHGNLPNDQECSGCRKTLSFEKSACGRWSLFSAENPEVKFRRASPYTPLPHYMPRILSRNTRPKKKISVQVTPTKTSKPFVGGISFFMGSLLISGSRKTLFFDKYGSACGRFRGFYPEVKVFFRCACHACVTEKTIF